MVPTRPFWHEGAVEWERPPHRSRLSNYEAALQARPPRQGTPGPPCRMRGARACLFIAELVVKRRDLVVVILGEVWMQQGRRFVCAIENARSVPSSELRACRCAA